ncbi:NADH dehydrogenase [ubiquinone] 1 alpha subcomplex subunit 5 isoform X1 [Carlito syrichta]|uniref:NADH dehydrogenase [ubiquinone] 1 alpha subcomplex subunit 5 n=1 Tax=Carlito syrichta TaxID=1868482 RepID=A0A1U7TBQ3_CARSF|nr:NADH dehydrogenase [ubiquinone] 1 alpha subcomplex subunit 5 isoform X1 [Carlito syrichta]
MCVIRPESLSILAKGSTNVLSFHTIILDVSCCFYITGLHCNGERTTGLVGLAVCDTPHDRLRILYTKILDVLEQIPKNAAYRKYTEQITNEKLAMVKAEPDVQKLEDQLQGGQLEEVILQAENELSLARKMMQWKPWEPLVEEPPADQWKWPM